MEKQLTGTQKIENLLKDGKFHTNQEICNVAWWRFGGIIWQMKKKGYEFEKKKREYWEAEYIEYWKIIKIPDKKIETNPPQIQKTGLLNFFL